MSRPVPSLAPQGAAALPRAAGAGPGLLARLVRNLQRAARLRAQRRALAALDDRMLADIGQTRAQALAESGRPFWDAPAHWRG